MRFVLTIARAVAYSTGMSIFNRKGHNITWRIYLLLSTGKHQVRGGSYMELIQLVRITLNELKSIIMRQAIPLLQGQWWPKVASLPRRHALTPGSSHVFQIPYENLQKFLNHVSYKLQDAQNQSPRCKAHRQFTIHETDDSYLFQEYVDRVFGWNCFLIRCMITFQGSPLRVRQCTLLHQKFDKGFAGFFIEITTRGHAYNQLEQRR